MSVSKENTKRSLKVEYKTAYDTAGDFPSLGDFTKTFNDVSENAPLESLKGGINALFGVTAYRNAPYKLYIVETSELVTN